jgi:protein SCO1/2
MIRLGILFFAVATLVAPVGAEAQVMSTQPAPLDGQKPQGALPNRVQGGFGVIERLGETVSPETEFTDASGETVRVGDLLDEGKPLAVAFVYHSCPMLCSLTLDGFAQAIREAELQTGEDYTALALSFDARDTPALAADAKEKYVEIAGLDSAAARGFHFWTGTEENIETFTSEVGFEFAWDAKTEEYAHHAILAFISPDGTITRYLYGIQHAPRDYRLALVEAGQGTVGSTVDRLLLTCYQFDPNEQSYSLAILGWMKWGGGLLTLALIGVLGYFWRREVLRQDAGTHPPDFASGAAPAA